MKFANLIKVSAEKDGGHNVEYLMRQIDAYTFEFGINRFGAAPVFSKRPMTLWERTYQRKIGEGYADRTPLLTEDTGPKYAEIKDVSVRALWEDLTAVARKVLDDTYSDRIETFTAAVAAQARTLITTLHSAGTVESFNDTLLSLFAVMPRKMQDVSTYLAADRSDFPGIIERENDLLDVIEGQIRIRETHPEPEQTILDSLGLSIRPCTDAENESIRKHLREKSRAVFRRGFRVKNKSTEERFWNFVEDGGYEKEDIRFLYHGSKNENMVGLLTEGPSINPDAVRTAAMFGSAMIYTADSSDKSLGYTSLRHSFWAHGTADKAYMLVYKVVYNNQIDIYKWEKYLSTMCAEKMRGHDALFCHKGKMLRNNEIVLPYEAQLTVQYLLELAV